MNKKTIVITGSTRGIGHGLAKEFLSKGHQVVINGRTEEAVSKALKIFSEYEDNVVGIAGDVTEESTHFSLLNLAFEKFGKLDFWINNAGVPQDNKLFIDLRPKDVKKISDINIYSLMLGSHIAANRFLEQGYGKIFNMEGFGSNGRIMKKITLYGTSKRAVNYFTKSLANELKKTPVQVCVLSPGMVRTEFLDGALVDQTSEEAKKFQKVYKVIAEDVDVVTKFLVKKMLKSTKNYDRIEFLSGAKMMVIGFKMMF